MKVSVVSISVGDQDKALDFYTRVLGFTKKLDIDMGGGVRWLTVGSPEQPDGLAGAAGAERRLSGDGRRCGELLVKDGIPFTRSRSPTSRGNASVCNRWGCG